MIWENVQTVRYRSRQRRIGKTREVLTGDSDREGHNTEAIHSPSHDECNPRQIPFKPISEEYQASDQECDRDPNCPETDFRLEHSFGLAELPVDDKVVKPMAKKFSDNGGEL